MKRLVFLSMLFFIGCAGMKVERGVQDNMFHSSISPQINIRINPNFKYIGKAEHKKYKSYISSYRGTTHTYESYMFVQLDDNNIIKKAIVIKFLRMSKGHYIPISPKNTLKLTTEKIFGKYYKVYFRASTSPWYNYEEKFLEEKGYILPKLFMVKTLGRRFTTQNDNDSIIYISYAEDIYYDSNYKKWNWKVNLLDDNQKAFMREFSERSAINIQIVE